MCSRVVTKKSEIDKLFKIYFSCIDGRYRFIQALKKFAKGEGYGQEYVCCIFASDYETLEEGYFGSTGVKVRVDYPAYNEDVIAIVSNEEFFEYLTNEYIKFINKFPDKKDEVNDYLEEIKNALDKNH